MGLLESLRNIKFQPSAGSMGLLNAGAQMLANSGPSLKPQGFGQALGQGIGGFTDGFMGFQDHEAEQEDALIRRQLLQAQIAAQDPEVQRQKMLNEAKIKAEINKQYPETITPYFQAIPTSNGYNSFNARTGAMTQLLQNGSPVIRPADDASLQGNITRAKESNKINNVTLGDGRQVPMFNGDSVGNASFDFKDPAQAAVDIGNQSTGDPELDTLIQQSRNLYNQRNGTQGGMAEAIGQSTEDESYQKQIGADKAKRETAVTQERQALPVTMNELATERANIQAALDDLENNGGQGQFFPGLNMFFDNNIKTDPQAIRAMSIAGSKTLDTLSKIGGNDSNQDVQFSKIITGLDPYHNDDKSLKQKYRDLLRGLDYKQQAMQNRLGAATSAPTAQPEGPAPRAFKVLGRE